MLSSFQEVLSHTQLNVISALYIISISVARASPLPYLYFCMRTKLHSFFLPWWAVEIGRASYRTDIYSLWSNWTFSLSKLCLKISLHYDTTWLSHNVSCVYLIASTEGKLFSYYRREQSLFSYSRLSDLLVLKSFMGAILAYQNTKWKQILNCTVYDSHTHGTVNLSQPLTNPQGKKTKCRDNFKSRYAFIFRAC